VRVREIAVLMILLMIQFMGPFSGNMIMPMFKVLKNEFQVEIFMLSLSITLYMVPFSVFQLFAGFISDLFLGKKRTMSVGLAVYCLGTFLIALSDNIWTFIASRLIQGVGNALISPILMATIGDIYPREIRGRIMGLMAISTTLGGSFGPLVGGYFALVNWRIGYFLLAFLSGLYFFLLQFLLPKGSKSSRKVGVMLNQVKSIVFNFNVIMLCLLGFILFFSRISFYTYFSDYLSMPPLNLGSDVIGMYISATGVGGIISGFIAGYLIDRIGRRITGLLGFVFYILILSLFFTPIWYTCIFVIMLLMGFASTMVFTSINTLVVEISPENRGIVTSIYGFIRFLGYALAPIIAYPIYKYALIHGVLMLSISALVLGLIILLFLKEQSGINL